jgi:Chromosome segregation ATPases
LSDSLELLKPNAEIADSELQIEIGDLKAENEILNAQFANLLESSTSLANELLQQAEILLAQLEGEKSRCDQLRQELDDQEESCAELRSQFETVQAENQRLQKDLGNSEARNEELNQEIAQVRSQLEAERADRQEIEAELSELKQNSARAATLFEKLTPDAAMILNQVRAKREKLKIGLDDLKVILKILASSAKKIEEET